MDYEMPHVNGVEAAKKVRALSPEVKLILASAYADSLPNSKTTSLVLRKPFGIQSLIDSIHNVLREGEDWQIK